MKADANLDDLESIRKRAEFELKRRVPTVIRLASELGYTGHAKPVAAGSYHVTHRIGSSAADFAVMRSTLADLFVADQCLLLEELSRHWLSGRAQIVHVPMTYAVRFRKDGAPFDFAVIEFIAAPCLRDLGDAILDSEPECLLALGQALRGVHAVHGVGAGLIDFDDADAVERPSGVHRAWSDYVFLNLGDHIRICRDAGLIDGGIPDRIVRLFDAMRRDLGGRPMRLLHGDPGAHNVCVDRDTRKIVALLDWEDALVGDPLFDLAMALTFQPPRRQVHLVSGYGLEETATKERRLLALYFLRIALSKTVHRLRFGIVDQAGRTPAHHRINRGIEELERLL